MVDVELCIYWAYFHLFDIFYHYSFLYNEKCVGLAYGNNLIEVFISYLKNLCPQLVNIV